MSDSIIEMYDRGFERDSIISISVTRANWLKISDRATQLRQELSLAEEGLANATQEIQELKRALNFWLPVIPPDFPEAEPIIDRIDRDARLLFKYEGPADEQCASEIGWVTLSVPPQTERR